MSEKVNAIRITKGDKTWVSSIKSLESRMNLARTSDPCDVIEIGFSTKKETVGADGVPEFYEEFESQEIVYQSQIGQSNRVAKDSLELARSLVKEKTELEKEIEKLKAELAKANEAKVKEPKPTK